MSRSKSSVLTCEERRAGRVRGSDSAILPGVSFESTREGWLWPGAYRRSVSQSVELCNRRGSTSTELSAILRVPPYSWLRVSVSPKKCECQTKVNLEVVSGSRLPGQQPSSTLGLFWK